MEVGHTLISSGACFGSVSTGLMHATPGEMKSLRSSADRIADIAVALNDERKRVMKTSRGKNA